MHFETSTGLRLAYDDTGGAGRLVVLLHGLSSRRTSYDAVVAHLDARGDVRVVAVDHRGHGDSGRVALDEYNAPNYARDTAELIAHLGGPAVVAGHSLGGVVAACLAAGRPDLVTSVLLEDPPLFEGDDSRRAASPVAGLFPVMVRAVQELQAADAPVEAYRKIAEVTSSPDGVDERCRTLRCWDPTTMAAAIEGIVWRGFDPTVRLTCPLTILGADPRLGAVFTAADGESMVASNPHAEIQIVSGATHTIHQAPTLDAYLAALDRVLDASVQ